MASTQPQASPPQIKSWLTSRTGIIAAVACVLVAVVALAVWAMREINLPRLNDSTVDLAKFVSGDQYRKLSYEKQEQYMKVLEEREDNGELDKAFEGGRISEAEFRAAQEEAWLGQMIKRSEKYAAIVSESGRAAFLADLLNKKARSDAQERRIKAPSSPADDVKRDETSTDLRIESFPPDVKARVDRFRTAYKAEKEAREKAALEKAAAQTPPAN